MTDNTARASGVDYGPLDRFKMEAIRAALGTVKSLEDHGFHEVPGCRGKSAHLIQSIGDWQGPICIGGTPEGIGTKPLVAQKMQDETGLVHWWEGIGQDAVAAIVNDVITEKVFPLVVYQHLAVASESWFDDDVRSEVFVNSWARACQLSRATWGGGETPSLKDVIVEGAIEISGASYGIPFCGIANDEDIIAGDCIVIMRSNGIHANSLTRARRIGSKHGYLTVIDKIGTTYGEALLKPTYIYVPIIEDALREGLDLHGLINVTGHGWRKLMRPERDLTYWITKVPNVKDYPEFQFMQECDPQTLDEQYSSLNMGAGFAAYLPLEQADQLINVCQRNSIEAFVAGYVEEGPRKVIIEPVGITYDKLWAA